jgi:hypothetical protein
MERYRRALERLRSERAPTPEDEQRLVDRLRSKRLEDSEWSRGLLRALPEPAPEALPRLADRFATALAARRAPVMQRLDTRGPDQDTVYWGFLSFSAAAAALMVTVVMNTEPAGYHSLQEIPDRFTRLVLAPSADPKEAREVEADDALEGLDVVKKESRKDDARAEAAEAPGPAPDEPREVAQARREAQAREEVLQQSTLLLALIGTTGDANSGDRVSDLFAEDDWGGQNLDAALSNVSGAEVATTSEIGLRAAQSGGEGSADIGDLAKAGTGGAAVGAGPSAIVEGVVSGGVADISAASGDGDVIKAVIRRYRGQIKYCYDARLKENPSLEGRIDVAFTVTRGRVTSANILGNTTGDAQLGSCIARKVESWRFDAEVEAEVVYPFILAL